MQIKIWWRRKIWRQLSVRWILWSCVSGRKSICKGHAAEMNGFSGRKKRTGRHPGEFWCDACIWDIQLSGQVLGRFQFLPGQRNHGTGGKRWEEKYGLKLVELSHDTLTFQSDRRISKKEAVEITEETVELCAEIVNGKKISRSRQSAEQGGLHYGGISA